MAGWYAAGTRPGDPGSAVILGHVDSKRGPAVFFRLRELRQGDTVTIGRADGSSVRFVVQRTEQYPKDRFPTDAVYYPTLTPALAPGDLRWGVRCHRWPLPVECDCLRHAGALTCPSGSRACSRPGPHLPVVDQAGVDLADSLDQAGSAGASLWSISGPDCLRLPGSRRILPCPAITLHSLRVQDSIALASRPPSCPPTRPSGRRWSGTAQATGGWQPSRFLANHGEAKRAFVLAQQLGSVNAAAQELATIWPSLPKAAVPTPGHAGPQPLSRPAAGDRRRPPAQRAARHLALDTVLVTLNPGALPARVRPAAELHEWVRRDEEYAILGTDVLVELNSESHARKPTTRAWADVTSVEADV